MYNKIINYSSWSYVASVFLISFFVGFFWDMQPLYRVLKAEKTKQAELQEKLRVLAHIKPVSVVTTPPVDSKHFLPDYWASLWSRGYLAGITFKEIKLLENHANAIKLRLTMRANFSQAYTFILSLHDFNYPVSVVDFSYAQENKEAFNFTLDLIIAKQKIVSNTILSKYPTKLIHQPFCDEGNSMLTTLENDVGILQSVPLTLLRMTGYFHQGLRSQALINVPGQPTFLVQSGSVLGKEHAIVTAITQDAIVITLPNQKKKVIHRYVG